MKFRNSFVSNSSSSSFIVRQCISAENLRKILDEALFYFWCERAKKYWDVNKLSKRQLNAVRRDMLKSDQYKDLKISKFNPGKFAYDCWNNYNVPIESLKNNWCINGDSYFLDGDLVDKLLEKVNGVYNFWG